VFLGPAVVQQVPDRHLARGRYEVGQQPAVAAPPQALRAHHCRGIGAGLGEHLVHRGQEALGPHVRGVAAEHVFAPRGVG
jgi:hypothetical protein